MNKAKCYVLQTVKCTVLRKEEDKTSNQTSWRDRFMKTYCPFQHILSNVLNILENTYIHISFPKILNILYTNSNLNFRAICEQLSG